MDKGNLGFGYPLLYEFFPDVIVHIELTVMMRRGKVAEYKLCGFLLRRPLPDIHDIANAMVDLAFFKVRQVGILSMKASLCPLSVKSPPLATKSS